MIGPCHFSQSLIGPSPLFSDWPIFPLPFSDWLVCVCFRDYLALNVYVALCYYKLDYYDVSQEVLQVYLQQHPDSAVAINLKACNHFKLYNGKAAEVLPSSSSM